MLESEQQIEIEGILEMQEHSKDNDVGSRPNKWHLKLW